MRYALFWRPRRGKSYRLKEFEARGFDEAVRFAENYLEKMRGEVGYLVTEILAAVVRPGQKFVALMDEG